MVKKTQKEIVYDIAHITGLTQIQIKKVFKSLAELAAAEIKTNGEFIIPGFGKLIKVNRQEREGRNPATGAIIRIPAKTSVKFRSGKFLLDLISLSDESTETGQDYVKNLLKDPVFEEVPEAGAVENEDPEETIDYPNFNNESPLDSSNLNGDSTIPGRD